MFITTRRRLILTSFLFLFCSHLEAAREVSLDLKGVVDKELNIERVDEGGTVDVFSRSEVRYRCTSNVAKEVSVLFRSQNGWVLRSVENGEVPYQVRFSVVGGRDKGIVDKSTDSKIIERDEFQDNKCEFVLVFSVTGSIEQYPAGTYSDRLSISVTAE